MSPSDDPTPPLASRYVRSLLLRHKVAAMRHVTSVADILGFTYTQVHRRMNGSVAWEVEEILRVAEHFGESLASVFAEGRSDPAVDASFAVSSTRIPCEVVLGDEVRDPPPNSLVATREGARWVVSLASQVSHGERLAVRRLEIRGSNRARRVAILDDDADEAMSLSEFFVGRGCEADAFTTMEALVGKMVQRRYDAYILDWIVGERSAAELVAMLRAEDNGCIIAILTGKIDDSRVEGDIAEALATYRLLFFEKPVRPPLVASQVLHAMSSR